MDFQAVPKVELHVHLDCSLSYDVVKVLNPSVTPQQYNEEFIAGGKCHNLNDYLDRAIKGFELMQTAQQLTLVTHDLFEQFKRDNVIYAEIRFAPLQHLDQGLDPAGVVEIVDAAIREAIAKTGIEARMILCTLRHFSEEESMQTVALVKKFSGSTVAGFDIAADEAGFPVDNHRSAFAFAHKSGIPCTAHAGEACGPESVWETLENFHPSRIGHGVRSSEDPSLLAFLKEHQIHLEICPTSNIQTHVYDTYQDHSVDDIFNSGVSIGINTDGRTISNVSLTEEYEELHNYFNWGEKHFLRCNLNAIQAAFVSDKVKLTLAEKVRQGYR